jgi:hypothetical protein
MSWWVLGRMLILPDAIFIRTLQKFSKVFIFANG